jgi:hypothetical protein
VELLARSPLLIPLVHGDTRRGMVRRFPYGLFFPVGKAEVVVLCAITFAVGPAVGPVAPLRHSKELKPTGRSAPSRLNS